LVGLLAAFPGDPTPGSRHNASVLSVECYDDGIAVRWRARGEDPAADPDDDLDELDLDVRIADDVGTDYWPCDSGSGQRPDGTVEGSSTFAPAVARSARRLSVTWPGGRLELDVTGVAERSPV
jgi:hypothetical protein